MLKMNDLEEFVEGQGKFKNWRSTANVCKK